MWYHVATVLFYVKFSYNVAFGGFEVYLVRHSDYEEFLIWCLNKQYII